MRRKVSVYNEWRNSYYMPDFKIDGVYYEIKNWHRPDTDFKISQFPKDKKIILIEGGDNQKFITYAKNKYGEKFYETLYEIKDYKESEKHSEYLDKIESLKSDRWEIIQHSNIDFSKYGWIKKISKLFGISENKAGDYIKRNYKDFYENICFKQIRGVYPRSDKPQKG